MKKFAGVLVGLSLASGLLNGAAAATLTNISFVSSSGAFVNDTIVGNGTSPLAEMTPGVVAVAISGCVRK
jgi:hypothetical protein